MSAYFLPTRIACECAVHGTNMTVLGADLLMVASGGVGDDGGLLLGHGALLPLQLPSC